MSSQISVERKKFEALVARAEADLARNPNAYKRKLFWLAGLGYGYVFGIIGLLVILIAGTVFLAFKSTVLLLLLIKKKLIFVLIGVLYVMIRALWVKLEAPTGYELKPKQFPDLFKAINQLRGKLQAPKIHQVIITPELNAAIQQTPRLGLFGWQKNTLILGLELMMNLSKEEMLAVISHELGHLSGNHSRFNGWIYRVRMTWEKIMLAFDHANRWAQIFFGNFFNWYAPYFAAYSFALARANEFEADAAAVEVTSSQALVNGLLRLQSNALKVNQEYWESVLQQADHKQEVALTVYSSMLPFVQKNPIDSTQQAIALEKAMQLETGHADTHPSIKERIAPYVETAELPAVIKVSAAEVFLDDHLNSTLEHFDHQWAQQNQQGWQERFQYATQARESLAHLREKPEADRTATDWFEIAQKTEEFSADQNPLALYRKVLALDINHVGANFACGRIMLEQHNEDGVALLEMAMADYNAIIPACELVYQFWQQRGDNEQAEEYRLKAESQQDEFNQANLERQQISAKDEFQQADIDSALVENIRQSLTSLPKLKNIWLAEKKLQYFPQEKLLVIVFLGKGSDLADQIVNQLELPFQYFVVGKKGDHADISKKVIKSAIQVI